MIAVVCWDPIDEYKPGEWIDGPRSIDAATNRGVAVLPYDSEVPITAVGPFMIRHWGQGWKYNAGQGERGCPMVIEVAPERPNFSWAVRIVADGIDRPTAQVRLISEVHQRSNLSSGLRKEVYCSELGEFDKYDGITVHGRSSMNANVGGLLFTSFFCTARNIKVMWSAISQHKRI